MREVKLNKTYKSKFIAEVAPQSDSGNSFARVIKALSS